LTNDFPTRRRTTRTTKQNLDPRCTYVPTRVKIILVLNWWTKNTLWVDPSHLWERLREFNY
jgi:hypothetical protein